MDSSTRYINRGGATLPFIAVIALLTGGVLANTFLDYSAARLNFIHTNAELRKKKTSIREATRGLQGSNAPYSFTCSGPFCTRYSVAPQASSLFPREDCTKLETESPPTTAYTGIFSPLSCRALSPTPSGNFITRANLELHTLNVTSTHSLAVLGRVDISSLLVERGTTVIMAGGAVRIGSVVTKSEGTLIIISRESITLERMQGGGIIKKFPMRRAYLSPYQLPQGFIVAALSEPLA